MTTRILVADDNPLHLKILRFLLTEHGYIVDTIANPEQIAAAVQRQVVNLIIAKSASCDSRSVLAVMRRQSTLPIILITTLTRFEEEVAALDQGADDVIAMPYEPAVLLARVRAALRRCGIGEQVRDGSMVTVGNAQLDLGRLTFTTPSGRAVLVTPTEMKILECLMRSPERVVSREKLIERTWGYNSESANNRIDVYMRRLRHKIEAHPKDRVLIKTVRGVGYIYQGIERDPTDTAREGKPANGPPAAWAAA